MTEDETTYVLIGGYLSAEAAREDYEAVLGLWGAPTGCGCRQQGPRRQRLFGTDRPHRRGSQPSGSAAWGLSSGCSHLRYWLRRPSGAAVGAVGGEALHKKIGSEVEKMAERTIPIGGAGLIVAYPRSAGERVEPAVKRAMQKVIGEAEGHHVKALKGALADAQEKMAKENAQGNG